MGEGRGPSGAGPIALHTILAAHRRIRAHVRRTPLVHSPFLSERTGGRVYLKLESLQPTGSFKVRGAVNKVGSLSPDERAKGLVTGSAGNHGLGVAHAAQAWGVSTAEVYVPGSAPAAKLARLRRFPIAVHQVGETYEAAHQAAVSAARESGRVYVPAYDDRQVIAGQGTLALEVLLERPETDLFLVPIGGGGLMAGVASAARSIHPRVGLVGVQPEASPAALLSLRDGVAYDPYDHAPTIADGLAGGFGAMPLAVAGDLIDEVLLVSERGLRRAIYALLDHEQLVVEPSGAIAIAPLLEGTVDVAGKTVVCVLSGGNLDTALMREILQAFG